MSTRAIALAALPALLAGCDVHDGVLAVDFALAPVAVTSWPAGVEPATFVSLPLVTGAASVDVHDGAGQVTARGLPDLPAGFRYDVTLRFAAGPRVDLPCTGAKLDLEDFAVGSLAGTPVPGLRQLSFGAGETGEHELGALRAAEIVLVPPEPEAPVVILAGEAGTEGCPPLDTVGDVHEH